MVDKKSSSKEPNSFYPKVLFLILSGALLLGFSMFFLSLYPKVWWMPIAIGSLLVASMSVVTFVVFYGAWLEVLRLRESGEKGSDQPANTSQSKTKNPQTLPQEALATPPRQPAENKQGSGGSDHAESDPHSPPSTESDPDSPPYINRRTSSVFKPVPKSAKQAMMDVTMVGSVRSEDAHKHILS